MATSACALTFDTPIACLFCTLMLSGTHIEKWVDGNMREWLLIVTTALTLMHAAAPLIVYVTCCDKIRFDILCLGSRPYRYLFKQLLVGRLSSTTGAMLNGSSTTPTMANSCSVPMAINNSCRRQTLHDHGDHVADAITPLLVAQNSTRSRRETIF